MIRCLKLVTGEELVAKVTRTGGVVTVTDPMQIHIMPTEQGIAIALAPYLAYGKTTEFKFRDEAIVTEFEVQDDLYNQYAQITGAIMVAPSKIVSPHDESTGRPRLTLL